MSTLADIVQQYGAPYQEKYSERLLPSHRRALYDIAHCRTATFGGHVYECTDCHEQHYQYHSCKNRHCPQCQYQAGQEWLAKQEKLLLPVPYFMVTFTLPASLQEIVRRHQCEGYNLLFRASSAALKELAEDPRHISGQIGMVGVLHTWGRNLSYHPHVHYLVPAGGVSRDEQQWLPSSHNFLVPVKALSRLFRGKFQAGWHKANLPLPASDDVWQREWVVHCQPVGQGVRALKYLAPYIFRVAISNSRILKINHGRVTFQYRPSDTGRMRRCTLPAEEFLRRFLQHVLPKGFVKVRYYGFFSSSKRPLLTALRLLLATTSNIESLSTSNSTTTCCKSEEGISCPLCGQPMQLLQTLRPRSRCPP